MCGGQGQRAPLPHPLRTGDSAPEIDPAAQVAPGAGPVPAGVAAAAVGLGEAALVGVDRAGGHVGEGLGLVMLEQLAGEAVALDPHHGLTPLPRVASTVRLPRNDSRSSITTSRSARP
jgi:hypothetical protein